MPRNSFVSQELPEPPKGLFNKIMARIQEERRLLTIKRQLVIFSLGVAGSAIAFIPAFKMLQTGLYESGFLQFFSLIFSDFGTVISYWQNFVMSLLETLPIINLAILLTIIFVFMGSLKFLVKDIKIIFTSAKLANN